MELRAPCDSKSTFPVATVALHKPGKRHVPVLSGGRVSSKGKFRAATIGDADLGDQTAVIRIAVTGRLGRRHSHGGVTVDVVVNDNATGQQADHCAARAKWVETVPERRVYSGATEQSAPVVLELSKKRRSVQAFWYGLFANCTPDGSIAPVDVITDFRVRKGVFGDRFSDEGPDGDGGTIHLDFSFHGRLSRSGANGVLNVTATDRDAAGNTIASCPSGDVRWTTRQ
jgi:hypothetical protein